MSHNKVALFGAAATIAMFALQSQAAFAAEAAETSAGPTAVTEVIVTAQKRQENIQNVGMSIQAATGDKLTQMGIHDTESLSKIVPGFQFTPTYYGTNVFTIRGVGFQDTSLAGSPTVTVYLDEMPIPFSALTNGATLDLQRVEVLKGPQGTLYGNNATGGAINYIANKPTDTFQAGADLSYGTFNDTDISGYVSGPVADGLDVRLALRHDESGAWQKSYGPQPSESQGGKDFTNGRFSVLWKPNDRFKALLTLNGWQDKGWDQNGQLFGIAELSTLAPLAPAIANFPLAPHNDQAADWNNCVNTSPYDPIAGQENGTEVATTGTASRSGDTLSCPPSPRAAWLGGPGRRPADALRPGAQEQHLLRPLAADGLRPRSRHDPDVAERIPEVQPHRRHRRQRHRPAADYQSPTCRRWQDSRAPTRKSGCRANGGMARVTGSSGPTTRTTTRGTASCRPTTPPRPARRCSSTRTSARGWTASTASTATRSPSAI